MDLTDPSASIPHAELVIHAAGDVSTGNTEAMERPLVDGTRLVADLAGRSGTKKFLFVSSGVVYGASKEGRPFKEDHQGAPDSCGSDLYGNGKRWGETLSVLRGRSGMKVSIARCFAFPGAFLPLNGRFALGDFLADGLAGKTIKVKGTGKPLRSYMDGGEMALWLLKTLLDGRAGRLYNVGSPDGRPIGEVPSVVADIGLECTVSFEESLRRMVIWNGGGLDES
nr:NAD(P)-dependent oxidoreductase [uncultured Dethiosulfovibrio sp.]